jgi:HD-like signal output (HDOD) protein
MSERKDILASIKKLPTFSPTVVRLAQLLGDEEAGPGEYEAVVQVDPALTANVLRMANSAHFGFSRKIGNVREAITLLGTRRLFELGALSAAQAVVPATLPGYGIDSHVYWCHSVAVAVLSERLAKERHLAIPTLTFTAGLLHDIGKLVISSFLASQIETLRQQLSQRTTSLVECERELLGWRRPGTCPKRSWWSSSGITFPVRVGMAPATPWWTWCTQPTACPTPWDSARTSARCIGAWTSKRWPG